MIHLCLLQNYWLPRILQILPNLEVLDNHSITDLDRIEAKKLNTKPLSPKGNTVNNSSSSRNEVKKESKSLKELLYLNVKNIEILTETKTISTFYTGLQNSQEPDQNSDFRLDSN